MTQAQAATSPYLNRVYTTVLKSPVGSSAEPKAAGSADPRIIEATDIELARINGRAYRHTYASYHDLWHLAQDAETQLDKLGVRKGDRKGARYEAISGSDLPNSYKYHSGIVRTAVVLERKATGWVVVGIDQDRGSKTAKRPSLILTEAAVIAAAINKSRHEGLDLRLATE